MRDEEGGGQSSMRPDAKHTPAPPSERHDWRRKDEAWGRGSCDEGRHDRPYFKTNASDEPAEGVRIVPASSTEHAHLCKLWSERGGKGKVREAWAVHNPRLAWIYNKRRHELAHIISRDPDELEGFHGSLQDNYLSIVTKGFDSGRRCGQAYGAGEYFAKNPNVSRDYTRGGQYMLVCRLLLGTNGDGPDADHVWAAGPQYYVMSQPSQVLPQYIIRFRK